MEESVPAVRRVAADRRVWGVTLVLVGWTALGLLTQVDALAESSFPIVYGYLFVLRALVRDFPAGPAFWVGLVVLSFAVAVALVGLYDEVRDLGAGSESRGRKRTE
jgi:hypothetical protein